VPQVPLVELDRFIVHWQKAAPWLDDGATWSDAGDLLMLAARATTNDAARRSETLRSARAAFRNAL
jgi:hypothetical protein